MIGSLNTNVKEKLILTPNYYVLKLIPGTV